MHARAATNTRLALTPSRMAGRLGATIEGVDLHRPIEDSTVETIWQALLTHRVFFRSEDIGHARHVAPGRRFGARTRREEIRHGMHPEEFPEILTFDPKADTARYGKNFVDHYRRKWVSVLAGWHSDRSEAINPPAASMLRAETTPEFGGDTQWTDTVAACQGLSEPRRALVDGLHAEHAFFTAAHRRRDIPRMYCEHPEAAIHPVVQVHPETGEKALFVSRGSTTRLMGLSQVESRRILDLLFEHRTAAEYTVRFRWEPGSIAFGDNHATCHFASIDFAHLDAERVMHRVTLLGPVPTGPDGFTFERVAGEPMRAW